MNVAAIGSVRITALLDAPFLQNPAVLTPQHAEQFRQEHRASLDERGLCTGAVTCYLVESAGGRALIDSGIGPRRRRGFPEGRLDQALRDAGVAPEQIDLVIHTHLHGDHVGWNTYDGPDGRIEPFFPNAALVIQQTEWDHWMTAERLGEPAGAVLGECVAPLADAGRVRLAAPDDVLLEHIGFIAAPGHTPGHVAIDIADGGRRAVIIGDASHHPFHVAHPDWPSPLDWDAELAARSRNMLYERAADEQWLIIGGHWPHPGWGRITREAGRRAYQPL